MRMIFYDVRKCSYLFTLSGFLPLENCINATLPTLTINRLWNIECETLQQELPDKHLYLRRHDYNFLKGTIAQYECEAGYGFENEKMVNWKLENKFLVYLI